MTKDEIIAAVNEFCIDGFIHNFTGMERKRDALIAALSEQASKPEAIDGFPPTVTHTIFAREGTKKMTYIRNDLCRCDALPAQDRFADASKTIDALPAKALTDEQMAWEATTPGYRRFVSDRTYRSFSAAAQKWYKPIQAPTDERPTIASVSDMMKKMNVDQRLDILSDWCHSCGGPAPCHCWNDE